MTEDEHRAHHVRLHRALDELFADYVAHQPLSASQFLGRPILALIEWSHQQTIQPTPARGEEPDAK
jgi:hypothetical protein